MKKIYILLIGFGILLSGLWAKDLKKNKAIPVSAPTNLIYQIPEKITQISLAKPVSADTTFFIRDDLLAVEVNLIELGFYKKRANPDEDIIIFVESAEYDEGRVSDSDIESVGQEMLYSTPTGSLDPEKGILTNELEIFGELPDVDNNGKLYILLLDVRDNYEQGVDDTYVAGYFDPLDQNKSNGNYADIIYIDTNPASAKDDYTLSVVAHELQHLIHHNYDDNENEWLNEGLSELAPRLVGLPVRSFSSFLTAPNIPLVTFDQSIRDYAKVGLWSFYLYKRFGLEIIKNIVEEPTNSLSSVETVIKKSGFSDLTKERLLRDWFFANLLNDQTIENGIYGYGDESIPDLISDHFCPNFTDGKIITGELSYTAAQYIQFYSGADIDFTMTHDSEEWFGIGVVKHYDPPEIVFYENTDGSFSLEDMNFGQTYETLTIVPYWKALKFGDTKLDFSYSATGSGGLEEQVIVYDDSSLSFYINLDGNEAGAKFDIPDEESKLSGIFFNVFEETAVTVKIYRSTISRNPIAVYYNIPANAEAWTRYDFEESVHYNEANSPIVALSSSDNSLGYCGQTQGQGRAYLKNGQNFSDLSNFSLENGDALDGDWAIRGIIQKTVEKPPELVISPGQLKFWDGEYSHSLKIMNKGTQSLFWEVSGNIPNWLNFSKESGEISGAYDIVNITVDRNFLEPGVYNVDLLIISNGGNQELSISILERNQEFGQTGFTANNFSFSDSISTIKLKVFNIGVGEQEFAFSKISPNLDFYPATGLVIEDDTMSVDVFFNKYNVSSESMDYNYYNGIENQVFSFVYDGELVDEQNGNELYPPFPNPFVTSQYEFVKIGYHLDEISNPVLQIFDILGKLIMDFDISDNQQGYNVELWDGKNNRGQQVSSGIYFVQIVQNGNSKQAKILLIR